MNTIINDAEHCNLMASAVTWLGINSHVFFGSLYLSLRSILGIFFFGGGGGGRDTKLYVSSQHVKFSNFGGSIGIIGHQFALGIYM